MTGRDLGPSKCGEHSNATSRPYRPVDRSSDLDFDVPRSQVLLDVADRRGDKVLIEKMGKKWKRNEEPVPVHLIEGLIGISRNGRVGE